MHSVDKSAELWALRVDPPTRRAHIVIYISLFCVVFSAIQFLCTVAAIGRQMHRFHARHCLIM